MSQPGLTGVAYSYLRFSTKKQKRGDSIRRQTELRDRWLVKNPGVAMAPDGAYEELGTSSFRGKHRLDDRGSLKRFITAVEKGDVRPGSFLIVESFDRLTREEFGEAAEFVLGLVNRGVRIVQLSPVEVILEKPVDLTKALILVVELTRGHGESALKSRRVAEAWEAKRAVCRTSQVKSTARCPSWLEHRDGKFHFKPSAKALVRRMFELSASGYGCRAVAAALNREKVPTWEKAAKKWHDSLIRRIVRGREALGEFQPRTRLEDRGRREMGDAIPGYYPAAVTEAEWCAAGASRATRARKGGRPTKSGNCSTIFRGLLRDALSGDNLVPHRRHGGYVLVPRGFKHRGEKGASFPLVPFERAILSELAELDPRDVLGTGEGPDEVAELKAKVARLDATLRTIADQFDEENGEVPEVIAAKVRAKNAERKAAAEALDAAEARAAAPLQAAWDDARGLVGLMDKASGEQLSDLRVRLRAALACIVESVTCLFAGNTRERLAAVRVQFRGSDQHRDYVIRHLNGDARAKRGAVTVVTSFKFEEVDGEGSGRDLRNPADARVVQSEFLADGQRVAAVFALAKANRAKKRGRSDRDST